MTHNRQSRRLPSSLWRAAARCAISCLAAFLCIAAAASPSLQPQTKPATGSARIRLQPRLAPGDLLRYQLRLQTVSDTKRSGVVADAQGPSQTAVTWDAILRVEVLPVTGAAAAPPAIRLRTTYEKSAATLASDTPDPQRDAIEAQYAKLEGRSLEFTLGGDGRVSNVQGLEGVVSNADAVKAAQQWIAQFSAGAAGPVAGVALDEKWSTDEPAAALPFAGYAWRSDSIYLRNEPCPAANPPPAAASRELCAVILTQITLIPPRTKKDPTPPEYSRNSLHTSGAWSGSGQSLSYISLRNGWVASVAQNVSEHMDVAITSTTGSAMRYAGSVQTTSTLMLLPATPAPAGPAAPPPPATP